MILSLKKLLKYNYNNNYINSFNINNVLMLPCIKNCVLNTNIGNLGEKTQHEIEKLFNKLIEHSIKKIKIKKSNSNFKVRKGDFLGFKMMLVKTKLDIFLTKFIFLYKYTFLKSKPRNFFDYKSKIFTLGIKNIQILNEVKTSIQFGFDIILNFLNITEINNNLIYFIYNKIYGS